MSVPVPESSDWLRARGNSRTELTNYLYRHHQYVDAQAGA